ncbi:hypothetical protein FACS1894187_21780 [Synergistales bacterium]|nr:hypothetical protein FACS1894187_21780 [Synergistales bacterium]
MGSKSNSWGVWSVAFVWFTTHFGGGFASGRQLVDFYVKFGWYAIFMPVISTAIIALVLYCAWSFAVRHKVYDYYSWSAEYYKPTGPGAPVFSAAIEIMYLIILLMATGVAFATGGTLLTQQFPDISYSVGTVGLAVFIWALTIWGAETVRKAATAMAILIISGMLVIYLSNLATNFSKLTAVVSAAPSENGGFYAALWQSVKYAALQCSLIGAYTAVVDVLHTQEDVRKTTLIGFVVNAGILLLAATGALSHYPDILPEAAPITYITRHGGGGDIGVALVSMIIILAVVSTGVGLIYGGARRVSTWWTKKTGTTSSRKMDIISSTIYVAISWCVASFGLIPLIAQGYTWVGILSTPLVVIPVLLMGAYHKSRGNLSVIDPE